MRLVKKFYGWPEDAKFLVPDGVRENFRDGIGKRGRELRAQWSKVFAEYSKEYPELAERLSRMQHHELPDGMGQESADVSCRRERRGNTREAPARC